MKPDDFLSEISAATNIEKGKLKEFSEAMASVLAQSALEQDSVAIPGFGTFIHRKTDEYVDSDGDKRILCPPHIELCFRPSIILRKALE